MAHQRDEIPAQNAEEKQSSLDEVNPELAMCIRDALTHALRAYVVSQGGEVKEIDGLGIGQAPDAKPDQFMLIFHCTGLIPLSNRITRQ